jgi:hypothetical protein
MHPLNVVLTAVQGEQACISFAFYRETVSDEARRRRSSTDHGHKPRRAFLDCGVYNRPANTAVLLGHVLDLSEQQPPHDR